MAPRTLKRGIDSMSPSPTRQSESSPPPITQQTNNPDKKRKQPDMRDAYDKYTEAIDQFKPSRDEIEDSIAATESSNFLVKLEKRMGTRLEYLSNVPRRGQTFCETSTTWKTCRLTPLTLGMLDSALKTTLRIHGVPKVYERDYKSRPVLAMVLVTNDDGEQSEMEGVNSPWNNITAGVVRMKELSFKGLGAREEDKHEICLYTNILAWCLRNKATSNNDSGPDFALRTNMAIRRMLLLSSFDGRTPKMFCLDDNVSSFMDAAALHNMKYDQVSAGEAHNSRESDAAPGVLGAEQTELLRRKDPDGGLLYIYHTVDYPKTGLPAPRERSSMVQWHLGRSPVMTEVIKEVTENMKNKKRTLVVVNDPFCQQEVVALIEMIGWDVGCVRASDSQKDREKIVEQFNTAASRMAAFVLNASLDTTGLNFHSSCSKGIIAQFPETMEDMVEIMGRLGGVDPKEETTWTILRVNGSYYDIQEDNMCQRFAEILQKEAQTPGYLESPTLRRIVAYERIRVLLSQPFNRYSWCAPGIDPPGTVQEYNDVRHRRLGQFYTAMARFLMVLPPELQQRTDDLVLCMDRLAKDFEEMDIDHECYEELTVGWVEAALDKHDQGLAAAASFDAKRSLKYKSSHVVVDSDDSEDECDEAGAGDAMELTQKEDVSGQEMGDAQGLKNQILELMVDMEPHDLASLDEIAELMPDPSRPLGPRNVVRRKDDNEALAIEQRKLAAMEAGNGENAG